MSLGKSSVDTWNTYVYFFGPRFNINGLRETSREVFVELFALSQSGCCAILSFIALWVHSDISRPEYQEDPI